jgi:site-specific DNA recombinase
MARVARLLRVSTDRQEREATVETQDYETLNWVTRGDHTDAGAYADLNVSGTVPVGERPEGARLLGDAARGKFDLVLVHHLDRWGRDREHFPRDLRLLEEMGVKIQSVCEPVDNESPQGRYILYNWVNFAAMERDLIRQRTMGGAERHARAGDYLGGPVPYGWWVEEGKFALDDQEKLPGFPWTPAEIVALICRWALDERLPCTKIADRLTAMAVPTPCNSQGPGRQRPNFKPGTTLGHWRTATVRGILTSTMLYGERRYRKSKPNPKHKKPPKGVRRSPGQGERWRLRTDASEQIAHAVPAIITREEFDQIQQVLCSNRTFRRPRGRDVGYVLGGLIFCQHCGRRLSASPSGPPPSDGRERYRYYSCPARRQWKRLLGPEGHPCICPMVRVDLLDGDLWDKLMERLRRMDETLLMLRQDLDARLRDQAALLENRDAIRLALAQKENERRKIRKFMLQGSWTEEEGAEELERLHGEESKLQAKLEELDEMAQALATAEERLVGARAFLGHYHDQLDREWNWDERRELIETFVSRVTVGEGEDGEAVARYTLVFHDEASANRANTALRTSTPWTRQPAARSACRRCITTAAATSSSATVTSASPIRGLR